MLTFLFWNLGGRKRLDILANLVQRHAVDILLLAECNIPAGKVLERLNPKKNQFYFVPSGCQKITIFTRFAADFFPQQGGGDDFTFRRLTLPNRSPELLVGIVHFPSKLRQKQEDQIGYAVGFSRVLNNMEETVGHQRTILVGDMNMNPYEDAVVMATGLHAVMTRKLAERPVRKVKFPSNPYFYNPMWSHFGDGKPTPPGTFFYSTPKQRADFWNIYDQVLLRQELLPYFRNEDLRILHSDGSTSFMKDDVPDDSVASDHLPILFCLNL